MQRAVIRVEMDEHVYRLLSIIHLTLDPIIDPKHHHMLRSNPNLSLWIILHVVECGYIIRHYAIREDFRRRGIFLFLHTV